MEQKRTFKLLLAILAVMLLLLPFLTTFNSVLTSLVNHFQLYQSVQDALVPFESRLVIAIIRPFGVPAYLNTEEAVGRTAEVSFYLLKGGEYQPVQLQWNCLGWQSLLLLGISLAVGLQGNFTRLSKAECFLIGFLGTFLINVLRMVFITVGIYYVNTVFALLIHDYFAALSTIIWLMFFWWFSYAFVLEHKGQA